METTSRESVQLPKVTARTARRRRLGVARRQPPLAPPGWWLLLIGLLVWAPAVAQVPIPESPVDQQVDSPRSTFVEELTVTSRALDSGAAATGVIDRQTIEDSNARTIAELVREVAGVHLVSFGSRGGSTAAQVRGGDPNFTLVLLDGVPLNNSMDIEGGTFNVASLPVASIERIEIVRGPNSFFFGSSALAGVINIVTRRGQSAEPRVEASIEVGEASLFRATTTASQKSGKVDYFLSATWEEERERIADEAFAQLNLQTNLGFAISDRSSLRVQLRYTDWEADDYPEASGGPRFGSGALRESDNRQFALGASLDLGERRGWRHSLRAWSVEDRAIRSSPAIFPVVPPSDEHRTYSRNGLGWLARRHLSSNLRLDAGLEVEREEADNESVLVLPPFLGGEISGDYRLDRTTPGLFGEMTLSRGNLLIEAGVRADLPEDLSTAWSPRLALAYRVPKRGLVVRSSWSQAFKLPSTFALASPPQLGGNPDLRPEESDGVDLGLDYEWAGGENAAGITLFRNRYKDLIDFDFDVFQNRNLSRVEADGIELYLRWRALPSLRLMADLSFQDVEDPESMRPLLHHPGRLGSLRLEWRATDSILLLFVGRKVGGSYDQQIPVLTRDSVDGYEALDLAATWRCNDQWRIGVRLDNLTDEEYENFIGFPEPRRSARIDLKYTLR